MSMQEHKKWVIGAFVVLALAMAGLLVRFALRAGTQAEGAPGDVKTMQELASQKEIAAPRCGWRRWGLSTATSSAERSFRQGRNRGCA